MTLSTIRRGPFWIAVVGALAFGSTWALTSMVSAQAAEDEALVEQGRILFEESAGDIGCAACHGPDAKGDIGPDIRNKSEALIHAAIDSVSDMVIMLDLSDDEVAAISAYLQSLGGQTQPLLVLEERTPENDAQLAEGKKIFEETAGGIGCAACHGLRGEGDVGPPNAGASEVQVQSALDNVPDMVAIIDLTHTELKAVVAYLDYLGNHRNDS